MDLKLSQESSRNIMWHLKLIKKTKIFEVCLTIFGRYVLKG